MLVLILGIFFSILSILVFFFKDKNTILILFLLSNFIMLAQYLLQGFMLESFVTVIAIIKCIVYLVFSLKKLKPNVIIVIVFEIAMLICGIITWSNWFSILFLIASMLNTYASWQDNLFIMRILYIIAGVCLIINYISTGLYVNIIADVAIIISAISGIFIYNIKGKIIKN